MKGLDISWYIKTDEGQKFLKKLSESDSNEIFQTKTVQMIISFLWKHQSKKILTLVLLPYIVYHCLFLLLIFYNENYFVSDTAYNFFGDERSGMICICTFNLVFIVYFLYIFFFRFWE